MLYLIGINHSDPLGRVRLFRWLQKQSCLQSTLPSFVGVEWDEDIFSQVVCQRPLLRELAQQAWPLANSDFLNTLASSLGYEGDTHREVFPRSRTLWLDKDRQAPIDEIVHYAKNRFNIIRSLLPKPPDDFGPESLSEMSKKVWDLASKPSGNDRRDVLFANLLSKESQGIDSGWAIVIVGANHASEVPGTLKSILDDRGIENVVSILRP